MESNINNNNKKEIKIKFNDNARVGTNNIIKEMCGYK